VLLHVVVQVALDRASIGVGGKNEPYPGRAQLDNLRAEPFELVAP
jgi:hypothetical protein